MEAFITILMMFSAFMFLLTLLTAPLEILGPWYMFIGWLFVCLLPFFLQCLEDIWFRVEAWRLKWSPKSN